MRYALCLSGFLKQLVPWIPDRDRNRLRRNMENALYDLPLDIFVSTWNIVGSQKGKIQTYAYRWPELGVNAGTVESTYGDKLKGFQVLPYNPRAYTPQWLLKDAHDDMHLSQRLSSMYFHVSEANRFKKEFAKKTGVKYDITIRSRPDLNYVNKCSDIIQSADYKLGRVFVPHCESYGYTNDQFMFGDSDTMDRVARMYDDLVNQSPLICPGPHPTNPLDPAERTMQYYLSNLGVEVVRCHVDYERWS